MFQQFASFVFISNFILYFIFNISIFKLLYKLYFLSIHSSLKYSKCLHLSIFSIDDAVESVECAYFMKLDRDF